VLARWGHGEIVLAPMGRVLRIIAKVTSISCRAFKEFVNRDFNTTINVRWSVMRKSRFMDSMIGCLWLKSSIQGLLELVSSAPLQSRRGPTAQAPFLAYLPSSSSLSLALLGSIVDEKKIFCFFSGTWRYWDSRIPDFRVLTFPLDFLVLKKLALFERIFYNQRNTISLYSSKGGTQLR